MSLRGLGVSEDGVWDPYQANHVAVQSEDFHGAVESKAAVCPGLSKKDINLVFLKQRKEIFLLICGQSAKPLSLRKETVRCLGT